jgi:L-ascorbate metabolism protein UlaG (beta-lactamase superfamily)
MHIHFLRHATSVVRLGALNLLLDPMLSRAEAMDPVQHAANARRIPLVELPLDDRALRDLLDRVDAVIVTHTHRDHWDARAIELLRKDIPLLCQPEDVDRIRDAGFSQLLPVDAETQWRGIQVVRTGGQHGSGDIGQKMGPVSGFVLRAEREPSLYIAGDTIWCAEVDEALRAHRPEVTILNAGAAQFLTGGPITMTAEDVERVCRALPSTRVIAVHMDAINHCLLTRADLSAQLDRVGLLARVSIPADGELIA